MKEIKKKLGKKTGYIITLLSLMMIALAMPTYASADLVEPAINNISGEETAFGFVILVATGAVICIAILSVVALIRIRDKRKTFPPVRLKIPYESLELCYQRLIFFYWLKWYALVFYPFLSLEIMG